MARGGSLAAGAGRLRSDAGGAHVPVDGAGGVPGVRHVYRRGGPAVSEPVLQARRDRRPPRSGGGEGDDCGGAAARADGGDRCGGAVRVCGLPVLSALHGRMPVAAVPGGEGGVRDAGGGGVRLVLHARWRPQRAEQQRGVQAHLHGSCLAAGSPTGADAAGAAGDEGYLAGGCGSGGYHWVVLGRRHRGHPWSLRIGRCSPTSIAMRTRTGRSTRTRTAQSPPTGHRARKAGRFSPPGRRTGRQATSSSEITTAAIGDPSRTARRSAAYTTIRQRVGGMEPVGRGYLRDRLPHLHAWAEEWLRWP